MAPTEPSAPLPHTEFAHHLWPADPRELRRIRSELRRWLAAQPLTDGARDDILYAASEAASNAVEHAYRPWSSDAVVELYFWLESGTVNIEIVDHGEWRTPSSHAAARSLGIALMHRLVESVMIHYDNRGTQVLLIHPVPGEARAVPSDCGRPTLLAQPSSIHGDAQAGVAYEVD